MFRERASSHALPRLTQKVELDLPTELRGDLEKRSTRGQKSVFPGASHCHLIKIWCLYAQKTSCWAPQRASGGGRLVAGLQWDPAPPPACPEQQTPPSQSRDLAENSGLLR